MTDKLTIEVASCTIEVIFSDSQKRRIKNKILEYLKNFRTEDSKIKYRLIFADRTGEKSGLINTFSIQPDSSFAHTVKVILRIVRLHIKNKGFILHCSASIDDDGYAVLFMGRSGSGKSIISGLLNPQKRKFVDDQGVIIPDKKSFKLYQSIVKETNPARKDIRGYPVKAVFFLRKSQNTKATEILEIGEKFALFYRQLWVERQYARQQYKKVFRFVESLKFYRLHFPNDETRLKAFFESFP